MTNRIGLWLAFVTLSFTMLSAQNTFAQGAGDLVVTPTRIVFENRTRSAQVTLANRGSATATFRISLIDMAMDDSGEMATMPDTNPHSATTMVRYAPRQIDIAPGAHQVVRLSLRKPANLEDGEYRSHMFFRAVPPESAGRSVTDETDLQKNELRIQLIPIFGVTIPVIVRNGKLTVNVGLSDMVHTPKTDKIPEHLEVVLKRGGNRSAFGDLVATYQPADGGQEIIVGRISRIAVYTPNTKRHVFMTLQIPDGITLKSAGKLRVTYRATDAEGGAMLGEQSLTLK